MVTNLFEIVNQYNRLLSMVFISYFLTALDIGESIGESSDEEDSDVENAEPHDDIENVEPCEDVENVEPHGINQKGI